MVKLTKQTSGGYNHPRLIRNNKGDMVNSYTIYNSDWGNTYAEPPPTSDINNEIPEEAIKDLRQAYPSEGDKYKPIPNESNWMDFQVSAHDESLPIYDDVVRDLDKYHRRGRGKDHWFAVGEGSIPAPAEGDFHHARRTHQLYQAGAEMKRADKKAEEEERIQND